MNPKVNKSNWSNEEDLVLFLKHKELGNKWSLLCKFLPGRTDNTIKNHWNSSMQKKINFFEEKFSKMIGNKNEEDVNNIIKDVIKKCHEKISVKNEDFYEKKMENYYKFKKGENMKVLKKELKFNTHGKKNKKRGRKSKKKNYKILIKKNIKDEFNKNKSLIIDNINNNEEDDKNIKIIDNNNVLISKSNSITLNEEKEENNEKNELNLSFSNETIPFNNNNKFLLFNNNILKTSSSKKLFSNNKKNNNLNIKKSIDIKTPNLKQDAKFRISTNDKSLLSSQIEQKFIYNNNNKNIITPNKNSLYNSIKNKEFSSSNFNWDSNKKLNINGLFEINMNFTPKSFLLSSNNKNKKDLIIISNNVNNNIYNNNINIINTISDNKNTIKNITPKNNNNYPSNMKMNTTNLDKLFFSSILIENKNKK